MNTQIKPLPILGLNGITIKNGVHDSREEGLCVMEAVAWVAGEPHSDHPECVCPIITSFLVSWNDDLPSDADRDRLLKPLVPDIIGTRSTSEVEAIRSKMTLDWLIGVYTPAWLDLAGLPKEANNLRDNPSMENCQLARDKAAANGEAARACAWEAAGEAGCAVVWAAAWVGARAGARAAARVGARVGARPAVWSAACTAAWAAAWVVTRDGAVESLSQTVTKLQESAVELVRAMIAVKGE